MPSSLALALTGLLVVANAFFVASEFSIVKIRPTRVKELAAQGRRRARLLSGILGRLDAYISTSQLGITLASLALGWIGEPTFARMIEPHLGEMGRWTDITVRTLGLGISFSVITFLHVVLGELVPKSLALQLAEPIALWTAAPLRAFYLLLFPIVWVLKTSANLLLRIFGLKPASEAEALHSPNELRMVLQHVQLDPGARRLIDRVFDYTQRVARHVMTVRRDVVVLQGGSGFQVNLKTALANQYTRYPLVHPDHDQVLGYVHIKDIVAALASSRPPDKMSEMLREPIYCQEDTRLEWLRREFQRRRVHIAIVLGTGNAFVGIVTMEDLLEEFVGEIQDEQDIGEIPPIVRAADGRFEADGRITLDVAARELKLLLQPQRPQIETLGAYIEAELNQPPQPGDTITLQGVSLTALEIRDGHIRRLRGVPVEPIDEQTTPAPST
jgi:CBS domain containing-hemolysin-like protein